MKKSIKCGIAAAMVVAAGIVAYQSYGAYGAQDNSLLMQNVEALAQDPDGNGDPSGDVGSGGNTNIKLFKAMASGHCAAQGKIYELHYKINLASHSVKLGFIDGKGFFNGGMKVNPPSYESKILIKDNASIPYGEYAVCEMTAKSVVTFSQCDRCEQKLCSKSPRNLCETDCEIPDDAVRN